MTNLNKLSNRVKSLLTDIEFYSTVPIISKSNDHIQVNDIFIYKKDGEYVVRRYNKNVATFILKAWAVAFAVNLIKHEFAFSNTLIEENKRLSKFKEDITSYQYHMQVAETNNNDMRQKILSDRLSRAQMQYRIIADEVLEKIKSRSFA